MNLSFFQSAYCIDLKKSYYEKDIRVDMETSGITEWFLSSPSLCAEVAEIVVVGMTHKSDYKRCVYRASQPL